MEVLEGLRRGITRSSGGTLSEVSTLPGIGDAGEAFTITLPSGAVLRYRLVMSGSRVFNLQVRSATAARSEAADAFLDSLRIQ